MAAIEKPSPLGAADEVRSARQEYLAHSKKVADLRKQLGQAIQEEAKALQELEVARKKLKRTVEDS